MKKNDSKPSFLLPFSLLLVGLVMLAEATIVLFFLQQLSPFLTQSSSIFAWGYTILKLLAGIIVTVSGAVIFLKHR